MASGKDRRAFLPGGLKAERVELVNDRVLIHAQPVSGAAACPRCGEISRRVNGRYERRLGDSPAQGRQVRLVLTAGAFGVGHLRAEHGSSRSGSHQQLLSHIAQG